MRVISIICIFLTVHTVFLLLYLGTLAACLGKSSSSCRRRRTSSQLTSPSPPTVGPSEPSMGGPPSDLKFWREKKQKALNHYSSVPNRHAGPNKRAGGKILEKY